MKIKRIVKPIAIALVYLALWEGASLLVGKSLLLPGPAETLARFFALLGQAESWTLAGLTILRVLIGYALGVLAGVLLGVLTAKAPFADALLSPLRSVVKATPVMSFILLAILWLSSSAVPAFIAFLVVLPVVWTNVSTAIRSVDPKLLEMTRAFGFSPWKRLCRLYAPAVLPELLAGMTVSLGFAWKSGVAAEVIAQPKRSIGYRLYQSKILIETTDLFAWTLLVILLSMLIEQLLILGMRRLRHD